MRDSIKTILDNHNKKTIIHTSSGSQLTYEKVGERGMATNMETRDEDYGPHSKQERGADVTARQMADDQMELPNALKSNPNPSGDQIKGYRKFTDEEVTNINAIKELSIRVGICCDAVSSLTDSDKRWLAIARTTLQQGFMALVRSIAKPETF